MLSSNWGSLLNGLSILLLWQVLFVTNGLADEEDSLNCEDQSENIRRGHYLAFDDDYTCCGTEKYRPGTGSDYLKYLGDCNIEPKNETMSLSDCNWAFYECIIKKMLESKELTQTSYMELMTQHMPDSKRSAILSLAKDVKTAAIISNGNTELESIKMYWRIYFDAEYQVCSESSTSSGASLQIPKTKWDPQFACASGISPTIRFSHVPYEEISKCSKSLTEKKNGSLGHLYLEHYICEFTLNGATTKEELSSSGLNMEALLRKMLPSYFSKALKEQIFNDVFNHVRIKNQHFLPNGMSTDVGELLAAIRKENENRFGNEINADEKNLYTNTLTIREFYFQIYDTQGEICYGHSVR